MAVQYASVTHGKAFLFTNYGMALAVHKFGQAAVDALPKFGPRSKHVGQPKGVVTYRKVTAGGWVRSEQRVERRVGQIITAELRELPAYGKDTEDARVIASWDADQEAMRADAAAWEAREESIKLRERAQWWADIMTEGGVNAFILHRQRRAARLAQE